MKINRVERLLKEMEENNIPQVLISDAPAIFYLTGKWVDSGSRLIALYLNVNKDHKFFINELFPVEEDLAVEKVWFDDTQDPIEVMAEYIDKDKTLGIDKNLPSRYLLKLMELNSGKDFKNVSPIIDRIRMIKDNEEINLTREASKINDISVEKMIELIPEGLTEKEMAQELGKIYSELGGEGFSFEPIIAYGANAADPHFVPGDALAKSGDNVLIDIGCIKDHYCSDMTRTVFYKEVSEKHKEIYNIVLEANKKAIEIVKPGVRFCDIDKAARDHIVKAGYGKYFTHRTGHSIGIEAHEFGDVSAVNTDVVEPGMIFSVEPGIYLPGDIGVRIEDLILVTEEGYENLNDYNKELMIIE